MGNTPSKKAVQDFAISLKTGLYPAQDIADDYARFVSLDAEYYALAERIGAPVLEDGSTSNEPWMETYLYGFHDEKEEEDWVASLPTDIKPLVEQAIKVVLQHSVHRRQFDCPRTFQTRGIDKKVVIEDKTFYELGYMITSFDDQKKLIEEWVKAKRFDESIKYITTFEEGSWQFYLGVLRDHGYSKHYQAQILEIETGEWSRW